MPRARLTALEEQGKPTATSFSLLCMYLAGKHEPSASSSSVVLQPQRAVPALNGSASVFGGAAAARLGCLKAEHNFPYYLLRLVACMHVLYTQNDYWFF